MREKVLRADGPTGSGRVVAYPLGDGRRLFLIRTYCPDRIGPGPTNLYLIEDEALILVDTGLPTDMAKQFFYFWRRQPIPHGIEALPDDFSERELTSALALTGHRIEEIDAIVLTHGHMDHYLLGRKIVAQSNARVAAHVSDTVMICNPWGMARFMAERWPVLMAMGMPPPKRHQTSESRRQTLRIDLSLHVDEPIAADGPLTVGDAVFPRLTVRHFAGHSPGGICLLVASGNGTGRRMLCGDTLLYPITPHPDDLVAYLRTLKAMKALKDISLTLPAHGKAIRRLPERLEAIEQHHERRLRLTYEACRRPRSIWQIATMTGYFDVLVEPTQFNPLAGQEAWVHAELLYLVGGLRRTHIREGVHYFENSGEAFAAIYERVRELIDDEQSTLLTRR